MYHWIKVIILWSVHVSAIPERMTDLVRGGAFHLKAHGTYKGVSDCARQARKGHCKVFRCVQGQFSDCPDQLEGHVIQNLCESTKHGGVNSNLTYAGVQWAKRTNHCFLVSLVMKAKEATCENIDETLDGIFDECAAHSDICDAIDTDYDTLFKMFSSSWMSIAKAARVCPRYILDQFVQRSMSKQAKALGTHKKHHKHGLFQIRGSNDAMSHDL